MLCTLLLNIRASIVQVISMLAYHREHELITFYQLYEEEVLYLLSTLHLKFSG
jgi:hypothetical protein